jgi:hypothetical protein
MGINQKFEKVMGFFAGGLQGGCRPLVLYLQDLRELP